MLFCLFIFTLTFSLPVSAKYKEPAYKSPINDIHVILFILDGVPKDFLYENIQNGTLSTLKNEFWDNGAHAKLGITTFPSNSASAYQSFITGLFAGRSGIPYLQWYDRADQEEIDYLGLDYKRVGSHMWNYHSFLDPNARVKDYPVAILDRLKGYPTVTVYSEVTRGTRKRYPKALLVALSDTFINKREDLLDRRAYDILLRLFKKKKKDIPKFSLVGLYSTDVFQHHGDATCDDAKYALIQFDIFLKEFLETLDKRGQLDHTYIIVLADHGMHNISHDVNILPKLKKLGLKARAGNLAKKESDFFISERGISAAHIYFKGAVDGRDKLFGLDGRPTLERLQNYPLSGGGHVDIIKFLREQNDLLLFVVRNGLDNVEVYSKECHATITKIDEGKKTFYGYAPNSCDPLDYCSKKGIAKMCGGRLYGDKEWFDNTWGEHYPDAVVQLGQIFDDGRAGDVFLVADDTGGFYREKHATHGSILDKDMQIPVLIKGPAVPKGEFGPIRGVDIFPTMLDWFGLPNDHNNDGEPIFASEASSPRSSRTPELIANMEFFILGKPSILNAPEKDAIKRSFRAKFNVSGRNDIKKAVDDELLLRNERLTKLNDIFPGYTKKDLEYSLIKDQIKKTQIDLRRLEDVKILIQ